MKAIILSLCFVISFSKAISQNDPLIDLNPGYFEKDFSDYDQKTAVFCAQLSEIAYWSENKIQSFFDKLIQKYPEYSISYKIIDDSSTINRNKMLLFGCKDFLVLAFRGTRSIFDIIADIKFWNFENAKDVDPELKAIPAGHGGFRKYTRRLIEKGKLNQHLIDMVLKYSSIETRSTFPIYTTGHSLGAALSQMYLLPLLELKLNYAGSYHFAPPLAVSCSINKYMRENFEDRVYDIVNYKDFVPRAGRNDVAHFGKFYRICYNGFVYKETEEYVEFNLSEIFMLKEFKLHPLAQHIKLLSNPKNTNQEIKARSNGHFPCMKLKSEPGNLCTD